MADTGQGATIAFTTSGFTALYEELGEMTQQGGSLQITHLGTVGAHKKMPQDNYDGGKRACLLFFDATQGLPDMHVKETITITYPNSDPENNDPATEAGVGWIVSVKWPKLKNNEVNMATIEIEWETAPAFTEEDESE